MFCLTAMCWPFGRQSQAVRTASQQDIFLQSYYAASFTRQMGCTEAEWLGWLPAAIGAHVWHRDASRLTVQIEQPDQTTGVLTVSWQIEPVRRIALIQMPCLQVRFDFVNMNDVQRYTFMRRFDLYMHRGGG
jgi:hypothetical protein